ncbi:hypothetical protein GS597_12115 [Synechococcales cyanobacterium C]|uniref:Uncharacterized protein n=1 Tax=Petrachloros mirabilis ULC683 TaxID=2781853 RepID=A0A8K2A7S9_9CYAN|nr:hypothetical protein [Petrachloros mirabilis]NCJ07236.1 hypothetical protein [Petrachloros mirabilis ULC683]
MYTIEITLRGTPLSLSVQRKESEDADALYAQVVSALETQSPRLMQLTCDRQPEKKVGILVSEITAVQISDKSTGSTARSPGFFGV